MKRSTYFCLAILTACLFSLAPSVRAQGSFTAASCSQSDVNAVINGPTHVAADGDVINIPGGSCTWSSGVTVPNGIGISIVGSGTPNSDSGVTGAGAINTTLTGARISMRPVFGNSTSRISSINFLPGNSAPITVDGTCTAGGCPNLRLDNLFFPTSWQNVAFSDQSVVNISNVFGVADHNTVGDVQNSSSYVAFINLGYGSWKGVGSWGDNSWADGDTFGTNQAFYLENNILSWALGTDTDLGGSNGGGARLVCRFNNFSAINFAGACSGHGTDTTGRARGVRQWEAYWNTGVCKSTTSGCGSAWPGRSGVGRSFSNSFTNSGGGFMKGLANLDPQRRWRPDSPWGACDGTSSWDTNDGVVYHTGTIGSVSGNGTGYWTITDSGSPGWSVNQWLSNGAPYSYHNTSLASSSFAINSFTANSITSQYMCQSGCTSTSLAAGQGYKILRATVCLDQPTRGGGNLVKDSSSTNGPVLASTGAPGAVSQALSPTYQAGDSLPSTADHTIGPGPGIVANRDYYAESVNQSAQTSASSPFNGSSGSGHGTFANRPGSCTTGVGYWATDQGNWNVSTGANAGKVGQLYVCTSTNTWTLAYTPFTYPHPLISGGGSGSGSNAPNPPTALKATVQ